MTTSISLMHFSISTGCFMKDVRDWGLDYIKKAVQMGDSEMAEYDKEMNNNQNN